MQIILDADDGAALDATDTMYPARLEVHARARELARPTSTTFGFVLSGEAAIRAPGLEAKILSGGFFSIPGAFYLDAQAARVVCIERLGFRGMLGVGRIEKTGRLAYIDGCSDTILCMPPRLGDAVLNHLHFPLGTNQSLHSHPSIRLGLVAGGSGSAVSPMQPDRELRTGAVFLLPAHEVHAFRTIGESMDVIAFHPDSDWGPTDGAHPMTNRTYLARADNGRR